MVTAGHVRSRLQEHEAHGMVSKEILCHVLTEVCGELDWPGSPASDPFGRSYVALVWSTGPDLVNFIKLNWCMVFWSIGSPAFFVIYFGILDLRTWFFFIYIFHYFSIFCSKPHFFHVSSLMFLYFSPSLVIGQAWALVALVPWVGRPGSLRPRRPEVYSRACFWVILGFFSDINWDILKQIQTN